MPNMWLDFNINSNQIEHSTERAMLLKLPKSSDFKNYKVWISCKLIRIRDKKTQVSFPDSFTFKIIKYGNGKYNSQAIIDERNISARLLQEMFLGENIEPEIEEGVIDDLKDNII